MAFSRNIAPVVLLESERLTRSMVGIGMNFAARADPSANIEDTLFFASKLGMDEEDLRVLAVLTTWLGVHGGLINADRLTRIVTTSSSARVRAFWSAFATWRPTDRRFRRLAALATRTRTDLLGAGTEFQIRRHQEDPRFASTPLRVPANVLRDRAADVLAPASLAKRHRAYHWRVVIGPSYRADMWALIEEDATLSAAEIARRSYGSFATAWAAKRDFIVVAGARR